MSQSTELRHGRLLQLLTQQGCEVAVEALVKELEISEATVRRDLATLEASGRVVRTFGGARLRDESSLLVRSFSQKRIRMQIEKQQIAQAAASLVRPGMTVALDSGSTIWRIAVALRDKVPLVVVTASLPVIEELGGIDGITLICPGGQFRQANLDFVGPTTTETISKLRADIAFLGGDSLVAGRGLFAAEPESAAVVAALSRIADRRVATLDHSKFTQGGSFLGVGSSDLHCVITDSGLPKSTDNAFASEPYELRRAE